VNTTFQKRKEKKVIEKEIDEKRKEKEAKACFGWMNNPLSDEEQNTAPQLYIQVPSLQIDSKGTTTKQQIKTNTTSFQTHFPKIKLGILQSEQIN